MTDRELLELAAKAAGMKPGSWFDGLNDEGRETGDYWNPLTDDGDALRLAAALEIDIAFNGSPDIVWADDNWSEPGCDDRAAATRRAIVRAAAAIGESMETQAEKNARFRRALDAMPIAAPPLAPGSPGSTQRTTD